MIVVESEESFRGKHYDTVVNADDASRLTSLGPMGFLTGLKGGDVRNRERKLADSDVWSGNASCPGRQIKSAA